MLLSVVPSYDTLAAKPDNAGKPDFVVNIKELKKSQTVILPDGRIAKKVVHVFYKEGFGHKPNHDKGGGPPDKEGKGGGEGCFAITKEVNWKAPESYIINPTNSDGLTHSFVESVINSNIEKWDSQVSSDIFGSSSVDTTAIPILDSPDNNNIVIFGDLDESGTIAVTVIWGVFSGPPQTRGIVSWDMIFEDPDFLWGDAGPTNENVLGDTNIMDFIPAA